MEEDVINLDVAERYKLCTECLTAGYKPGCSHCLSVIRKRVEGATSATKWLNPYYIEKHPTLEQPLKEGICEHCRYKDEHEMREFVSNL